jgi:1-aminocyclopropane-1-carboxylate deaminase
MYKNIATQSIRKPLHKSSRISVDVLRLDLMHPDISGNKWFKLKYHIEAAIRNNKRGIVTLGGAYSNHLVATAVACKESGMLSTAFVRGEQTFPLNASVMQMINAGMQLIYVSRERYRNKNEMITKFLETHKDYYYVPEGGQSPEGIKGAGEILSFAAGNYTHIVCAVGTGTTIAGLINASTDKQKVIGVCALKIEDSGSNEIENFIRSNSNKSNFTMLYDYHFGGYAKKTNELTTFMNGLFNDEQIPTDFVYTGKMFCAVYDLIVNNYFPDGSRLLLIHTGGLQGNRSLPAGTLVF